VVVVNAALLFVLNGQPGWQALPFLTSATSQVLGLVNLSLAVGLAVNLVYREEPILTDIRVELRSGGGSPAAPADLVSAGRC